MFLVLQFSQWTWNESSWFMEFKPNGKSSLIWTTEFSKALERPPYDDQFGYPHVTGRRYKIVDTIRRLQHTTPKLARQNLSLDFATDNYLFCSSFVTRAWTITKLEPVGSQCVVADKFWIVLAKSKPKFVFRQFLLRKPLYALETISRLQLVTICGFHVTQVSLIITQVKNKIVYHSINWVKKLNYRRRVINKHVPKFRGCAIFWPRVIRKKVSIKL